MNCSWDVSQVIYLFHSYILFLKFRGQAICRIIFIFLGNSAKSSFFFEETLEKVGLVEKKCFKILFAVLSLSLINKIHLGKKKRAAKKGTAQNQNCQCFFGSYVKHLKLGLRYEVDAN